jgi:hypothetical protein
VHDFVFGCILIELRASFGPFGSCTRDIPIYSLSSTYPCPSDAVRGQDYIALRRVCRQVRAETSNLPFILGVMYIGSGSALDAWCQREESLIQVIRTLRMYTVNAGYIESGGPLNYFVDRLQLLSGLQKVEVVVRESEYSYPKGVEKRKEILKARIKAVCGAKVEVVFLEG